MAAETARNAIGSLNVTTAPFSTVIDLGAFGFAVTVTRVMNQMHGNTDVTNPARKISVLTLTVTINV